MGNKIQQAAAQGFAPSKAEYDPYMPDVSSAHLIENELEGLKKSKVMPYYVDTLKSCSDNNTPGLAVAVNSAGAINEVAAGKLPKELYVDTLVSMKKDADPLEQLLKTSVSTDASVNASENPTTIPEDVSEEQVEQEVKKPAKEKEKTTWISNFINWFVGLFTKKTSEKEEAKQVDNSDGVKPVDNKPKLEKPDAVSNDFLKKALDQSANELEKAKQMTEEAAEALKNEEVRQAVQLSQDITEAMLLKAMINALKTQKKISEDIRLDAYNEVDLHLKSNKELQAELANLKKDLAEKAKASKTLGWIGFGFGVAVVAAGILTFFTAGTFAAVVGVMGGIAAVASGSTGIAKAVFEKQANGARGDIEVLKYDRQNNQQKMEQHMTEMNAAAQAAVNYSRSMRQILDSERNAATAA